jgi:hypothetical protein
MFREMDSKRDESRDEYVMKHVFPKMGKVPPKKGGGITKKKEKKLRDALRVAELEEIIREATEELSLLSVKVSDPFPEASTYTYAGMTVVSSKWCRVVRGPKKGLGRFSFDTNTGVWGHMIRMSPCDAYKVFAVDNLLYVKIHIAL